MRCAVVTDGPGSLGINLVGSGVRDGRRTAGRPEIDTAPDLNENFTGNTPSTPRQSSAAAPGGGQS
jgi:hypothetical protein